MYLEKLEIQGFKSFANKNKLIFSGILDGKKRGITVVVGPNGSGKSNIADAIRWVLGEQSSKLLRSKKSEDVIFSGSDKKGRLNMAEVSLFLNNEDSSFLINRSDDLNDLNEDGDNNNEADSNNNKEGDSIDALLMLPEIIITRRVFRDGNSEYFINNNKVRLSDIQIFLAKANFGQKTYSVIGQGMVENFLNTSPVERKAFFDEATGVKQYQIKRDISLNKLENSQENLAKVEMLLNEIEPRLKSLTRQVSKLKKRNFLEDELLKNQLNYYSKIWNEINVKLNSFNENILKTEKEKNFLEKSLEEDKKKLDNISQGDTIGEEFYELQKRFLFLKSEQDRAQKQIEKIYSWKDIKDTQSNDKENDNLSSLSLEKNELSQIIEEYSKKINDLNDFSGQSNLEKIELELLKLEDDSREKHRELSKIEAWIEIKLEKQGKFDLSFLNNRQSELKDNIIKTQNEINLLTDVVLKKEKKVEELKNIENEISEKILELEKELNRINIEESPSNIQKINNSLKNLIKKIDKNNDLSDNNLLKEIIKEINLEIKELLNFSSGENYRYKIESINNKIINLKEEKNKITNNIFSLRLEYNSEQNKQNELKNYLSKIEKEILEISEKIKLNKNNDDIEENKSKKEDIEKSIKIIDEKIIKTKKDLALLKEERDDWREKKVKYQEILQKSQSNLNDINNRIGLIKTDSIKIQSRLEDLELDIKNNIFSSFKNEDLSILFEKESDFIENFKEKNNEEILILQQKIDNFNQEQENKKKNLLELQKNINDLENKLNQLNESINNDKINLTREETRIEDLENNILEDKLDLEKVKKHSFDENLNANILKDEIIKLKNQLELIGGIDPETEKEYEETKKRFDFLFEQTEDLNKTVKSLEKVIIELDMVIKNRFELEFKIISEKFNEYFKILFNGGNAKIFPLKENSLMEEQKQNNENGENINDNFQNKESQSSKNVKLIKYLKKYNAIGLSGVDIMATPPGKKISSVSMLSGGERALTAIALICAIISANPSPFVVLDEVDAALDEANSERLVKILDDLSDKTQFITISHNRSTMKKANIIYGVTMESDGVSKLLSIKLDESKV